MIYPNMATMLSYLTTDAAMAYDWMKAEVKAAVDDSFNMISMDGDMSTNDTCVLFANGLAGNTPIDGQHPEAGLFRPGLRAVSVSPDRDRALCASFRGSRYGCHTPARRAHAHCAEAARP